MPSDAILVTGAAGFIGFHVTRRLLSEGRAVVGVDSMNHYYDPALKEARLGLLREDAGFAFEKLDLADRAATKSLFERHRFAKVIHLAAQAGVRHSLDHPHAYTEANVEGFLNILEGCRHHGCAHLVFASSSSVYGANTKLPFAESDVTDSPVSLYGATKKACELMSRSYAHLYRTRLTGLRFFTVYGPWGRPDMAAFLFADRIMKGEAIPVFNRGDMMRDFTYIDDIVAGILGALDHPAPDGGPTAPPHRVYNLGNNRSEKLLRYISVLERELGVKARLDLQPMQPGDVKETAADITASARDLGFAPATPIDVGIPRFVKWYKEYRKKTT